MFLILISIFYIEPRPRSVSNHSGGSSGQRYGGSNNSINQTVPERKTATPNSETKMPLYSNIEYSFLQNNAQMLPLHQYILEQAKLSGTLATTGCG